MKRQYVKVIVAFAIAAASAGVAFGQETPGSPGLRLWVGYYGELGTHPGIAAGAQFALVHTERYQLKAGPVVGFYIHPRNNIGFFVDAELENRFATASGLYFTVGASAGYLHSWLTGDGVYVRDPDGGVSESLDWGRPHIKTGGSLGLGWNFGRDDGAPVALFSRIDIFAQYPYNNGFLPHAAILAGASYLTGGNK